MPYSAIQISCSIKSSLPAESIRKIFLAVENWSDFKGFGVVPGIHKAKYIIQTDGVVGSRIQVTNVDGSSHLEEIVDWRETSPDSFFMTIKIQDFKGPLRRISTGILETWAITVGPSGQGTTVVRSFWINPLGLVASILLRFLIGPMLRIAIKKHLREILL